MTVLAKWHFKSSQERDAFLFRTWPRRRKIPKLPGMFAVPGGDRVAVSLNQIVLYRRRRS